MEILFGIVTGFGLGMFINGFVRQHMKLYVIGAIIFGFGALLNMLW